jgi:hypothetical protein
MNSFARMVTEEGDLCLLLWFSPVVRFVIKSLGHGLGLCRARQ